MYVQGHGMYIRSLRTEPMGARSGVEVAGGVPAADLWFAGVTSKSTIATGSVGDGASDSYGNIAVR